MITPPKLRAPVGLKRRLLLFVLPVLTGVGLLMLGISYRQGYFENYDDVSFTVDSAGGISRGMPVKLKGLMVGQVRELSPSGLDAAGNLGIVVSIALNQRYTHVIPSSSEVTLAQEGLIGQSFIEILPGSGNRMIASGESLVFVKRRGIKEIIESASAEAIPILQDLRAVSQRLSDPTGDLQTVIKNTAELSRQLPQIGRQTLATVDAARTSVEGVGTTATALIRQASGEIPNLVVKVDEVLDNVKVTSGNVKQLSVEMRGPILGALDDGRHLSAEARQIVGAAKQAWPLSAILPSPAHESVLPDSATGAAILVPRAVP